jgi:hypothetical protein
MSGKVYEKRAQLETRSPLTLVTTLEVDDIPTVELAMTYDDGTKKKVKVPTHELESVEQVFYCFHEFLEAARKLSLDGAEWFEFYRDTLRGHARSAWDLLSNVIDEADRTEATFRTTFRAFVATIVDETAHRTLLEYLRATVKPRTMSVMELSRRVQILCLYSNDLPTESGVAPQAISDEERKTMFYNMMPEEWKTSFTRSNLRVSGMSITQMTIYFNSLCALESAKNKGTHTGKRGRDNNNSNDTNNRNNRYRGSGNSGGRNYGNGGDSRNGNRGYQQDRNSGGRNGGNRGGRGRGGRGGRGRGNGNRPQGDDACPIHGGHKWRECFLNPYGDNYRPRNGNSNGNGQGRGNGSRRGDSYHTNNESNGGNNYGGQGNGSNDNNNNNSNNNNDGDRRGGNSSNNSNNNTRNNNNDHYLADIGMPDWNQE